MLGGKVFLILERFILSFVRFGGYLFKKDSFLKSIGTKIFDLLIEECVLAIGLAKIANVLAKQHFMP